MIEFSNGADYLASLPGIILMLMFVFFLAGIGGDYNATR